ncbi:sigma-70 family RNA polymerase sigma factor [Aeoliella mucimassa]|uniref:RNA polymerase sigma factor SigL n=1 Tax=Aeoliella mucimassa TaxID=2527972 RepID=A0A518AUK0_9BACT|nr:sigma-70 family RNA polymerase sigma factor [Aeoliella mucimassa]QDU58385.1 RNA polymerase sigma factor SigL [Aeoliella mucimassa]
MGGDQAGTPQEQRFVRLFAQTQRALHAYILALVYDPNVAADLLQETNIVLWKRFADYDENLPFLAWARGVARRTVLNYRRSSARQIATLDPQMLEELAIRFSNASAESTNRLDALGECLRKLRESDRSLIMARYQPGNSVNALADKMSRPVNSVSQSLTRIRRTLADCVQRGVQAAQRSAES